MSRSLSIVGPTATGKTSFALWVAERLIAEQKTTGADLISADSRQVYRELPIISGADIPERLPEGIKVYGVGILNIDEDWSVAHFRNYALPIIQASLAAGRLPVIVGGTGLYHRHLFNPELSQQPGPNLELRAALENLSVEELQQKLVTVNPERLASMNNSDRMNPRRLVRAIEQAQGNQSPTKSTTSATKVEPVTVGLTDTLEHIEEKIKQRVEMRWQHGAIEEVKHLSLVDRDRPALSATGVNEIRQSLAGQFNEEEAKSAWALREFQYAKRQLTWWKAEPHIKWFDVNQPNWQSDAYTHILTSLSA